MTALVSNTVYMDLIGHSTQRHYEWNEKVMSIQFVGTIYTLNLDLV